LGLLGLHCTWGNFRLDSFWVNIVEKLLQRSRPDYRIYIVLWAYGQSVNMEYMTLRHPGPVQKVKVTLLKNVQVFVACSNTILYWYSLHATVIYSWSHDPLLTRLMFADLLIKKQPDSQTARSEFVWRGNEAYQPFPFSALTLLVEQQEEHPAC